MHIRKLSILLALAATFALGTAVAQESDDSAATDGAATERQRPDREQNRQRRDNLTDEERAAARERWEGMSDEERQAARDRMKNRRGGNDGKRGRGQRQGDRQKGQGDRQKGDRPPKAEKDAA